jgi:hypothetical protein
MILSTKTTIKFSNEQKKENLKLFNQEYKKVCQIYASIELIGE